jgi:hypothetical protein
LSATLLVELEADVMLVGLASGESADHRIEDRALGPCAAFPYSAALRHGAGGEHFGRQCISALGEQRGRLEGVAERGDALTSGGGEQLVASDLHEPHMVAA